MYRSDIVWYLIHCYLQIVLDSLQWSLGHAEGSDGKGIRARRYVLNDVVTTVYM